MLGHLDTFCFIFRSDINSIFYCICDHGTVHDEGGGDEQGLEEMIKQLYRTSPRLDQLGEDAEGMIGEGLLVREN